VCARWPGLAALLAAAAGVAGCGGANASTHDEAIGGQLAVYSSLPLQGPSAAASEEIIGGEKLALADAGGRAGRFKIGYVSLDDSNPANGEWSRDATAADAKAAAQDTSTIAYLGDLNSAATAISLSLTNSVGIPQISPSSPYVGLTSSLDAGQDEPARFYLSGRRTFARLDPGDPIEAQAQARLMRSLGIRRVFLLDDLDPFQMPLAHLVAADAAAAGVTVVGHDSITVSEGASYTGEAEKVAESGAEAVFFSGGGTVGAGQLWQALHRADPRLILLGSSSTLQAPFTGSLGAAASSTYITTPIMPPTLYPRGRSVLSAYRRTYGRPGDAYALYGYDAMSLVLDAIRAAGARGNDRTVVAEQILRTRNRYSVLGVYSILDGETTLSGYAVDRVEGGRSVFYRAFSSL
jgi:branched-chain amino acid transport system substrate-binding protein